MAKDFYNPQRQNAPQFKSKKPKSSYALSRRTWQERQARSTWNDMTLPGSAAPKPRRARVQRRHELMPPEIAEDAIEEFEIDYAQNAITRKRPLESPPPCFYFSDCKARAEVEKQGKAVCGGCASRLNGTSYPLRKPRESTYNNPAELLQAMNLK